MNIDESKTREAAGKRSVTRRMRSREGFALFVALAAAVLILVLMMVLPENEAVPPNVPGPGEAREGFDAPREVDPTPAEATQDGDSYEHDGNGATPPGLLQ
jgi:hypothetical protein